MLAAFIGASRGVGYHTVVQLLSSPSTQQWTAILLVRKPEALSSDPNLAEYISSGRLQLIKGDATVEDDIRQLFDRGKSQLTRRGFINDVPDLCTRATVALLHVLAEVHKKGQQVPRVITVSTMGVGENHKVMPLVWRILYPWLLRSALLDKGGLEYLFQRASTVMSPPTPPSTDVLSATTISSTLKDFIPEVIILRGAAYVEDDQPPKGRKETKIGERLKSYTIRRAEVARVIVEDCLPGRNEWVNKLPVIGY
ncbi:hypothetical protein CNBA6970 [Cryptococcus deneoformans B-3501A]|uniref:hypothetical protein n=1 Tax=Cryptococcus deneoformans (strain B-3501A) TaxID=283643 RepID=UPI000042F6D6|nr:hypothetical protein CNBA6970 [Cryptococcus neoformans var. neoformans B-3501A]EAL22928.1 hypothetical protein CNBA6970 [Cryptococcus neoformans var. neoformans B-3501A]